MEIDQNVPYGATPTYDGSTPTKSGDAQYNYTWIGWTPNVAPVTEDAIYTAQFSSEVNAYTITWKNWDGSILEIDQNVPYGTTPTYDGAFPTRPSDEQYSYTWTDWSPSISVVTGNQTYVAQYRVTTKAYTVTWKNYDGSILEIDNDVSYGSVPHYDGATPIKAGDAQYSYFWTGWTPSVVPVTGNATYVATFSSTSNTYTVTWKNYNGSILETDRDVPYGTTPTYDGETPTRPSDSEYAYTWTGWDPEIRMVTSSQTYTATYSYQRLKDEYTVDFDLNGGTSASYSGPKTIEKFSKDIFFFDCVKEGWNFRGWSYNGTKIFDEKGNQLATPKMAKAMTFVAMYSQTAKLTIAQNLIEAGRVSGEGEYPYNTYVDVSASANQGYEFVGWYYENTLLSNTPDYKYMMWNEDVTLEARFKLASFLMDIHTNNEDYGLVLLKSNINFDYRPQYREYREYTSEITIAAYSKTDTRFLGWYDSNNRLVETNAVYSFAMPNHDYALEAKWNYFTVSYELNGGVNDSANPTSYNLDSGTISLRDPSRNGYDFVGWQYKGDFITQIDSSWIENITLNAVWRIKTYAINYELDGGTNTPSNPTSYDVESETIVLGDASREGYFFEGWYIDPSLVGHIYEISAGSIGDKTLYAKWTPVVYSITYNLDGGVNDPSNPETYTIESSFVLGSPTKTGYSFVGWFDENGKNITSIEPGMTGALSLTARWNDGDSYLISLDPNGGAVSSASIEAQYGHAYSLPVPTRAGYTFDGWYDGAAKFPSSGIFDYSQNKILVAHWSIIRYSITYDLKGGRNNSSNPTSYTVEDSITFLNPTKTGYTFIGWFDENGKNITSIEPGMTGALSLTARWNDGDSYLISLDPNGGAVSSASIEAQYGHAYSLPVPTRAGYTFDGWYDGAAKFPSSGIFDYSQNKILVAHWSIIRYSITYDLKGGRNNPSNPTSYTVEDSITFLNPTKTGYTFIGWFDENGKNITSIEPGMTGALSLTARWNDGDSYLISLDPNGGAVSSASIEAQYGHAYSLPVPTRTGYTFDGWYDGAAKFPSSGIFDYSQNKILVAHWSIIRYSITYDLKGGSNNPSNPTSYTIEDNVTFLNPTKTGYTFSGWFNGESKITELPKGSTGNLALEARWSVVLNNLAISSNDTAKGTVAVVSGSGYTDETITVVATPEANCVFKGWFHNQEKVSNNLSYSFKMPPYDYSLIARFMTKEEGYATKPILSSDGKTVKYGLYPQTNVNDSPTITALNALIRPESNGWYLLGGDYYAKTTAKPYESNYKFDNGATIKSGQSYWFKCEPIVWNVLGNDSGEYFVLSSVLLDAHRYYSSESNRTIDGNTIYANNYEYSDIRSWLNNDFYNSAFFLGNEDILVTDVDNSVSTTDSYSPTTNKHACNNTKDKVFLPSYLDYQNSEYGFSSNSSRFCKTTDWARARGAYCYTSSSCLNNGFYWTRSPHSRAYDAAWIVDIGGSLRDYVYTNYYLGASGVYYGFISVRPSLSLRIA